MSHQELNPVHQGLLECSYGSWYPRYAELTPASRVIDLDPAFVNFLHEDGLVLHEQSEAVSRQLQHHSGQVKQQGNVVDV